MAVHHDDTLRPPTFCIHLLISVTVLLRPVFRLARADQKLTVIWLILFPVGSIDCKGMFRLLKDFIKSGDWQHRAKEKKKKRKSPVLLLHIIVKKKKKKSHLEEEITI